MAIKRKNIIQPRVKLAKYNKALSTIRARLDALKPKQPGDGVIRLDPREWGGNGGFVNTPGGINKPMPGGPGGPPIKSPGFPTPGGGDGMIHLDPREWNGGFNQPPAQQFEDAYNNRADALKNQERSKLQALLQQRQFQKPQPGPRDGGIQLDPREWGGNGGFQGLPQLPPRTDPGRIMQPIRPTHGGGVGSIRLDPREWGENGGFNQMPKLPNPPMKQQPVQMPGLGGGMSPGGPRPMPMPGLGGGMPPQGPKQMPMPNPKRNLIPRPIDPRYKLM